MKPFYPSVKRIPRLYYWIAWALCNLICGMTEWVLLVEYGNGNAPYMLAALCAVGLFHFLYLTLLTIKESDEDNKWGPNEERKQFEREADYYRR